MRQNTKKIRKKLSQKKIRKKSNTSFDRFMGADKIICRTVYLEDFKFKIWTATKTIQVFVSTLIFLKLHKIKTL